MPERPAPDPLSDVLRTVNLTGAVFFDVDARAPWVAQAPAAREIAQWVRPGVDHVIEFHLVSEGSCYGGLLDEPPLRLEAGDIIVFPHGDAHVLSSRPGMRTPPDPREYEGLQHARTPIAIHRGPAGQPQARIVCGFLGCTLRPFNPLIAALPRVLHDRKGADEDWPRLFAQRIRVEASGDRAGRDGMLTKLSELMFLDVVRRHLETLPPAERGWLAALREPTVGRALAALHADPARRWSLEGLARAAAVSRSVLAERFREQLGIAPMQYLAQWRMQLAAGLLESPARPSLAAIAGRVGYESEAAFQRAFKKLVGMPPGSWRPRKAGVPEG